MKYETKGLLQNIAGTGIKYTSLLAGVYTVGTEALQYFNSALSSGGVFKGNEVRSEDYILPVAGIIIGALIDKAGDRNLRRADLEKKLE